jgi:hypothetical protein
VGEVVRLRSQLKWFEDLQRNHAESAITV